jgi:nucleotide-binding universal stress UspA family protein
LVDSHRKTLDEATAANFNPKLSLLHGDPMVVIPHLVRELDADILTVGTTSRKGIAGLLFGNTAEEILNRVSCSVVTLKPQGFNVPD